MPTAPLDQFMHPLIWKAVPSIILCGIGVLLLRELLHWIERRNQRRNNPDQKQVTMNVTGGDIAPRCPSCNGAMIRRRARHGSQMGKEFWGCFAYPRCRGTRAI